MIGSNSKALTWKTLAFWISGCFWEVISHLQMVVTYYWKFDCNSFLELANEG